MGNMIDPSKVNSGCMKISFGWSYHPQCAGLCLQHQWRFAKVLAVGVHHARFVSGDLKVGGAHDPNGRMGDVPAREDLG